MAGDVAEMMLDGTMDPETGEFNFDGEDGPGFPMTHAEAQAYRGKRSTAYQRGGEKPAALYGIWLHIALQISRGHTTIAGIEAKIDNRRQRGSLKSHLGSMQGANLIHARDGHWFLTKRGREQLEIAG